MGIFEGLSAEEIKSLGKRLKERRKQVGISTQEKFAERLGCHAKTVKNWEQGQNMPELSTLVKICHMLQCSIDYLLGNIDETTHDIHFISHETELTEKSVRGIQAQWLKYRTKEEIISFDGLAVKRDGVQEGGYVPVQYADAFTSVDSLRDFWKVYGLYSEIGRDDPADYVERLISIQHNFITLKNEVGKANDNGVKGNGERADITDPT